MTPRDWRCVRHAYMTPIRTILGMANTKDGRHFSNAQVLTAASVPSVEIRVRISRLAYFRRFLLFASPQLRRLVMLQLECARSWIRDVFDDLTAMHANLDDIRNSMLPPQEAMKDWFDFIRTDKARWRGTVRKFQNFLVSQPYAPSVSTKPSVACEVYCEECSMAFQSVKELRTHDYHKHAYRNPVRLRATGTLCLCCSTEFHTRKRLIAHASRSARCSLHYMSLTPNPVDASDKLDRAASIVAKHTSRKEPALPAIRIQVDVHE